MAGIEGTSPARTKGTGSGMHNNEWKAVVRLGYSRSTKWRSSSCQLGRRVGRILLRLKKDENPRVRRTNNMVGERQAKELMKI
jgi:hypothetical protein